MESLLTILIAMFNALVALTVVVFAMTAAYLGHRVIHGIRIYFKFRGTRLVTCPETHEPAVVELAARSMGMQAFLDEPCLRLRECTRWPMRGDCGQDCLAQIEARPSEIRMSAAWRAS
jgi:hypothetical protein